MKVVLAIVFYVCYNTLYFSWKQYRIFVQLLKNTALLVKKAKKVILGCQVWVVLKVGEAGLVGQDQKVQLVIEALQVQQDQEVQKVKVVYQVCRTRKIAFPYILNQMTVVNSNINPL